MKKRRVGILYGGKSPEHEVSKKSAKNIIRALDTAQFVPVPIYIPKNGTIRNLKLMRLDVVFPIVHGTGGEDGTLQGYLETVGIPYVGAGVLGSALGMDKEVAKRLLEHGGIPIVPYIVATSSSPSLPFPYPVFVKPSNNGSSVGVTKVKNKKELSKAILLASQHGNKVLIEQAFEVREVECAVLGNPPRASIVGEIIPRHEFYDYDAKYIDPDGAQLVIPADISPEQQKKIQNLACHTYTLLECRGMARVDFFIAHNKIYVNEINTLPGFTNRSMYPLLWSHSGISYTQLITELITQALKDSGADLTNL